MPRGNPQPWFRTDRNLWYVTLDGVQHNLQTADRDQAIAEWHRLMARPADAPPDPHTTTVVALLALYADWSEKHNTASTHAWYARFLKSFVRSIPRHLTIPELKPFHVTRWLDAHAKWGVSSRRGAIAAIKRALNWAVDEGYLGTSPVRGVRRRRVAVRSRRIHSLPRTQKRRLSAWTPHTA